MCQTIDLDLMRLDKNLEIQPTAKKATQSRNNKISSQMNNLANGRITPFAFLQNVCHNLDDLQADHDFDQDDHL